MTGIVYCLGDVMVDVVARMTGPIALGSDTPSAVGLFGGGSAANTACWLATAGAEAVFVGRIGDDALGVDAVRQLNAAGVTTAVTVDRRTPTGTCVVLVDPSGERTMLPDSGANATLDANDLPVFAPGGHLHVSGYALLGAGPRDAALAALKSARDAQLSISLDASSAAPLAAVGAEAFLGWVGTNVLMFANSDEARVLTGRTDARDAAHRLAESCGEAIVKSGRHGSCYSDGDSLVIAQAVPTDVVDTTGAGDAFAAGFLTALLSGAEPGSALRAGHALAARAVAQLGARPT